MPYTFKVSYSPNFTPGREGKNIQGITIHHWGADGQNHDTVAAYLSRPGGNTSAHYVASAGKVTRIVHPTNTAWHAGTWDANLTQIGIECRPECTDEDFKTVAELVRNLRNLYGPLPLYPHSHWIATACPGRWAKRINELSNAANTLGTGKTTTPAAGLSVDGYWGTDTTRALQRALNTPQDGVISSQSTAWKAQNPGLTTGWEWTGNPEGSQTIQALQRALNITPDGLLGPNTIKAIQQIMHTPQDGCFSSPSTAIKALQTNLNNGKVI